LVTNYDKFKAAGAEIIAISVDPPDKSQKMAEQLKIPYPILSDDGHKVIDSYSILDPGGKISTAAVFILDKQGIVRWTYVASDYKVRPLDDTLLAELAKLK
jgi:thioredoxin-dependent peroxiredoxin